MRSEFHRTLPHWRVAAKRRWLFRYDQRAPKMSSVPYATHDNVSDADNEQMETLSMVRLDHWIMFLTALQFRLHQSGMKLPHGGA